MSPLAVLRDTTPYFSPLWTGAVAAFTFYFLAKYIYRVTFHPLATFPGPRLAALTNLYGAFYDLLPNRSYCKQFPALHDRYGPIVRTLPNHLSIRDIGAYNQIFKIGTKFDKHSPFYTNPFLEGSYFPIGSVKTALTRKTMHSPLFSKDSVRRSEHLITDMLAKFLDILSGYDSGARPVDLSMAVRCLTADVSMNYAFQRPLNALDAEDFQSPILNGVAAFQGTFQWPIYFPNFFGGVSWVTAYLPGWFIRRFMKPVALVGWCLEVSRQQIAYLQNRSPSEEKLRTVFDINLNPNLEKGQFTPMTHEMVADAFTLLMAGTDTVAHTVEVITWELLNNPQVMQKLKAELRAVMPGREDALDWAGLEKLTYLRAVIREGLRLSYGVPGRLPRVVPSSGAVFCGQKIPAGTIVSSSCYMYHHDPQTFKDDQKFQPERWLADATVEPREMESKFMPFSKGSRACIGMNLAYAELHLILAHLFRRFEIANFGTSDADMEWDDCFAPMTRGHLKVSVRKSVD